MGRPLMKHRSALLLLIAGLVAASQSASLPRISSNEFGPLPQSAVCAQTCNLLNRQIQYTPGQTYVYNVQLMTRIGEQANLEDEQACEPQEVQITAVAEISAYSQCELVMKLRGVTFSGFEHQQSEKSLAAQLESSPIHFALEDGVVTDVCADQADEQWLVDVKKSIISALQMSSQSVAQQQTLIETDISGRCETVYEPLESNSEVTVIRKTKNRSKCSDRHQANIAFFPASYGINQALQSSLSPLLTANSSNECTQVVKGQIVESVACEDRQTLRYPLNIPITSRIELQLTERRPEITVQRIEEQSFRRHRLTLSSSYSNTFAKDNSLFSSTIEQSESRKRDFTVSEVQHLLKGICAKVAYSVHHDVPVLFHELITALHYLPAADQAQVWTQVHSGAICSSPKLQDLFLDAAALSGSEGSIEVLLQAYQQQHVISPARANYLFGLLAFSKQPTVGAARRLVNYIKSQHQQQQLVQLPRGVLFGATGFVHNLQVVAGQRAHQMVDIEGVRAVVRETVSTLIEAIKTIIPQASTTSPQQQQQALTLIYSLKNLVLVQELNTDEQLTIARQLVDILRTVSHPHTTHSVEISAALVRTLVNAGIDDSIRQYLLESILIQESQQPSIELQIEAYRAVVLSGATQSQLQLIKQWTERTSSSNGSPQQQLVNYIRSHQANLRTTSDPHKQAILPAGAPVFESPSGAWFGVSRNYELSYVNQGIGAGVTLETDVIYQGGKQSPGSFIPVPQTVAFNFTIPIGGQELQLVEVRLHQHGLEPLIEKHMRQMEQSSSRASFASQPWKVARETLKYIIAHGSEILEENPSVRVLLQVIVDGKTVVLADEQDLISNDSSIEEQSFMQELMARLHSTVTIDRAFAVTPIDSVVRFPSVNGLPVTVRLNSTFVIGFKSEVAVDIRNPEDSVVSFAIYPSVAATTETAVAFHAGPEKKVVEYVQSVSSAPQLNFLARVNRGRIVTFKVDLPKEKYTLARIESVVYSRNAISGERVRLTPKKIAQIAKYPDVHICSRATEKALGVSICYDLSYGTVHHGHGLDILAEVTVVKTDAGLSSYEATLESPLKFGQIMQAISKRGALKKEVIEEMTPFRFHFNTPGSEVDRKIALEVELANAGALVKEARLRLRTPWKAISGQAVLRNEAKERVAKLELTVDEAKWMAAEVALEVVRRGPKTEWKPRVVITALESVLERPIHLTGALSVSRGRKTAVHLSLEDVIARQQYITAGYIRERPSERNGLGRTSADLSVSLRGLVAKGAAAFELGERLMKVDISSDYKLPSWRRAEKAKVALKLQNHSNNEGSEKKVIKMTGIGQIKASQLSKYEITYSQNVHVISGEQLEHDLKLDWASQQEDSSNNTPQIRLHQSAQKTGQRGKIDLEAASLVIYRPENVHYEVKATGGLIGVGVSSGLKRYNIAIAGEGKHSSKSNFRGELSYEQKAKSPALKMEMAAQLKAPEAGIDFVYRDEIEEKAPGQYHGHLLVQMSPAEKYDVTYVYRLKNDRSKKAVEHSMEVMLLKDARKRVALKHYGLLRLEDGGRAMSLKSRLTDEENKGADIWNAQVDLAPGRKEISFSHLPREIRAQAKYEAVYEGPSSAQWSFASPAFNHQAEYENSGPQGQYWSFDSKTKKAGENLMEIQSKHNAKLGHRRLRLSSQYFDGECELELPSTNEQSKKAKLRFDLPNSWAHESTFSRAPISSSGSGLILVDSRTQYQGAPVVDLAARYEPQSSAGQFKLNTPLNSVEMQAEMAQAKKIALKKALLKVKRGADYEHQSQLAYEPSTSAIDFESVTSKSGKDMAKVKYQYAGDEQLLHQFDLATPEDYSVVGGQWSGRFDQRRRSAKIDWTNKAAGMKHNTQISCAEPQQQIISIDSSTTDYQTGAPILLVKGAMDPKERSYISLQSGKARKVNFETRRSKRSAKLDLDYDQYRHQSEISGGDYDDDNQQQKWKAKSSTRKAGKSIFDFDAQIQPSQQYGHISLSRGDNGELFKHESTFKMEKMMDQEENKKSAHLKSNTLYRGEPLAELDAMLSGLRGANKVDGSIIGYELKSLLDMPSQVASVDLKSRRSGRHLLGSVAVNQEAQADRSFHFDFAWDIDRDPASKVALDLLIKRVPIESRSRSAGQQVMIEASAAYAESKLVYNMQYVPKSGGFSSPHPIRLSLSFIPSPNAIHNQRDSWQLIYLHRMEQSDNSAFTCKWEWIVGGQRQYSLQLNGKIEEISGSKKFIFSAKTTAPASKPQLAATFNLVAGQRAPNQYFFDASATAHGDQKRYQAVFDLTKHLETRKVDGKLEIRLPAFQVHVAAFSLDLTERKFSLELINEKTGKVVEVEASYAHHLTHLKVASQGASSWFVPKVDALVRYVPGEELHARLALDEERKFELTAKYSGELSKLKFYVLTKVDSVYTPSVEFIAEGRKPSEDDGSSGIGAQRSVAITGKWNMVEVVKGSFNQAAVRQWTAEGFVAAVSSGEKIVEGSVVSTPGQSEHYTTYEVKVQPKESNVYGVKAFGAKIEERRPTAENEYIRSVKVELFQAAAEEAEKKLILSTEVSLKHRKWAQVPEMVEISLRHIPSASHGSISVAIREQVKESEQQQKEDYSSLFSSVPETASIASQKRSSVLRDQMLIGWNQKSVGFALITSEWASAEAVEHSLKVYTPSGRVVKHRCGHVWSDELIFMKQSLKTDEKTQREPLYQSTVIVQKSNPIQGGSYIASGYTGKLVIESFKFARSPKTVSFEVKPASQQRPLDAKLVIDIAQSEKEALTLKAVVERKAASTSAASSGRYFGVASLNQTIHFEAKSADASVLDFAVDGHVSQSSVGLLWKNLNRKGRQQQGHYLLQFIGEDRFEAVLSNPAAQYHVSGIYKRKDIKEEGSPMVMDLTIKKSISKHSNSYYSSSSKSQPMLVSEHKVHIESTDRCIRAEIEDVQKISSSRQVNLCADLKRANIFNLDIDSISGNGQKTAEFSARLDAKSAAKTLALGAHWNPVYSRKLLQTLLNIKESASTSEDLVEQISRHEVVQELSAKYSALFRSLFSNAAQPLTEVAKELAPIAAEYGLTEEVLQKWTAAAWAPIGAAIDSVSEYSRENIDQLIGAYTEAVEEVKKACARSTSCRSVSEALEKGNEEVARLASRSIVGLLQKTHRFVVKTKGGALLEKLKAEEVLEQLQAMVPEPVTEAIKSAAQTAYGWARDVTLNPSGPFAGVFRHLENIFGELIKGGSDSIRWERIESSVSEAVHLLTSPSAWASSVRVLLWDPVNGQLAVEVKSPQTFTTAAAIAGMGSNETENINSNSSSSSWLNGINSYDRYAAKARFF